MVCLQPALERACSIQARRPVDPMVVRTEPLRRARRRSKGVYVLEDGKDVIRPTAKASWRNDRSIVPAAPGSQKWPGWLAEQEIGDTVAAFALFWLRRGRASANELRGRRLNFVVAEGCFATRCALHQGSGSLVMGTSLRPARNAISNRSRRSARAPSSGSSSARKKLREPTVSDVELQRVPCVPVHLHRPPPLG